MEFKTKRRSSFIVINIFMFLGGIEYGKLVVIQILSLIYHVTILIAAVIFPTLWEYLRSLGVPEADVYYLGLCISGN